MLPPEDFYELALTEIRELKRAKPELESLLDYYEAVLQAQREAKSSFHPDLDDAASASRLDIEVCRKRTSEGLPFLKPEDVRADGDLFGHLFDRIGQITRQRAEIPDTINSWSSICGHDGQWQEPLLKGLLEDKALLEPSADRAGVSLDVFAFLVGQTFAPFLETYAERFREHIGNSARLGGCCPICGGEPLMGRLERESGKRVLGCYLCRTEWVFRRLECPFCGSSDQEKLRFFYDQENPRYRVEVCDRCKTYLKTVDARERTKEIPLLVENLATLDLDLVAEQEGFRRETTRLFGL